jgi:stage IV sporulation protein FB
VNLSLRVLGIPVVFGPSILLGLGALGLASRLEGTVLVAWIALGLVALLLHELGHALVLRRFGLTSRITFFLLGGVTIPDDPPAMEALPDTRMLAVALAGPGASLAVGLASLAAVLAASSAGMSATRDVRTLVWLWLFVNIGWALFNMLPIGNLDGGRAVRHLLAAILPGRIGVIVGISANLLGSVVVAFLALQAHQPYIAFIAVVFGLVTPSLYGRLADAIDPSREQARRIPAPTATATTGSDQDDDPLAGAPYEPAHRGEPRFRS